MCVLPKHTPHLTIWIACPQPLKLFVRGTQEDSHSDSKVFQPCDSFCVLRCSWNSLQETLDANKESQLDAIHTCSGCVVEESSGSHTWRWHTPEHSRRRAPRCGGHALCSRTTHTLDRSRKPACSARCLAGSRQTLTLLLLLEPIKM